MVFGISIGPAVSTAEAQIRQLQRAVQKNVQTAVNRQRLRLRIESSAGPVEALDISPDGRYMISVSGDARPRLWDLQMGRQIRTQDPIPGGVEAAAFASDGRRFALLERTGSLSLWAVDDEDRIGLFPTNGTASAIALSPDGALAAIGYRDGTLRLVSLTSLAEARTFAPLGAPALALDYGSTGQFILVATEDGTVRVLEANSGAIVREVHPGGTLTDARFGIDETEFLTATASGGVQRWRVDQDSPVATYQGGERPIAGVAISTDGKTVAAVEAQTRLLIWEADKPRTPLAIEAHRGRISGVGFDSDPNRVVSFGEDGVTRVWNKTDGSLVVQLISTENGWAVIDGEGRFDGSSRALANLSWVGETLDLPVDNFTDQLYEPDLLQKKRLGTTDYLSPGLENWDEGILPPPVTQVEVDPQITLDALRPIEVGVTVRDEGGGIERINLYHNSKLVSPDRVTSRNERDANDKRVVELVYSIRPVAGRNQFNANAVSSEAVTGMTSEAVANVIAPPRAPELHVLTIGLNEYLDSELNLNYAIPDATAIRDMMQQRYGQIFASVNIDQVFNEQATVRGIKTALRSLRDTAPEDVVVIYYAGHGEASSEDFYFITYEFELPLTASRLERRAFSTSDLRAHIEAIGARRVILLIDACKSGTAVAGFADRQDRRVIRQLGQSVGLHIVSATAKEQFAVEHETLGHGVFTYSLIQAMEGAADREPRDGNLTVREVVHYSEDQVPELSLKYANYQHWPLIYSRGLDFTLSRTQ